MWRPELLTELHREFTLDKSNITTALKHSSTSTKEKTLIKESEAWTHELLIML